MALALETLVKQLEDSGIISQGKLENFVPPKAHPKDGEELLRELFKQNLLTKFQAQQFAQGRAKALILGGYTILDKIGAGGMGQVFKAEHRRMKRLVAIKMLPSAMTKDAAAVARFQREVEAAAKLFHPNIVPALDADEANGVHFLVMEYVEGQDLSALVKKNGPFPVAKAVNYILQAARGLEFAHGEGVIHRDIKPANLLLDKKGVVKILDMGLARIESAGDAATQAELTGTGAVMGTVDYMAPEQAMSTRSADARADIYSLGCSLFYLLTGKPTYDGETVTAKLIAHQAHPIPELRKVCPEASEELEAIFNKMMAKKIEDRYQTMTEVIADLERCGKGSQTSLSIQQSAKTNLENSALTFLNDVPAHTTHRTKPTKKPAAVKSGEGKQPPWKNTKVLIGAGVLGVLILVGIIVSLQTKVGTLIVEVDQPDAMVQVLDEQGKVEVSQKGGVGKVTIGVDPGKKRLRVEKDGFVVFGQEFEMESGGKKSITAKLVEVESEIQNAGFALDFDGTTSFVNTLVLYDGTYPLTVEALANPRSLQNGAVLSDEKDTIGGFSLGVNSSWIMRSGRRDSPHLSASAASNKTVHLAGVIDGQEIRLYVGGVLKGTKPVPIRQSSYHLLIGANPGVKRWSSIFDGIIDEVRISKIARYTGNFTPEPRFTPDSNTIALYHFDEGSGDTAFDSSDNKHHAKIVGAKWVRANASESNQLWNTPAFQAWMKQVATLPANQQLEAVSKKLVELNPGFDGKMMGWVGKGTPKIVDGMVTELGLHTVNVSDISPVRALPGLKALACTGSGPLRGKLSDLSPLTGMQLTTLVCALTQVSDLTPLQGTPLEFLRCHDTQVHDLSPLRAMPLKALYAQSTQVSALTPLEDCKSLTILDVKKTKVTPAGIAALQKALPNCKIEWDDPTKATTPAAIIGSAPPLATAPFDAAQAKAHQEAWATHLGIEVETTNCVGMKMVLIPPGEFKMGTSPSDVVAWISVNDPKKTADDLQIWFANEQPQHRVHITKPFRMSATEVTVIAFKQFVAATGFKTEAENVAKDAQARTYLNPGCDAADDMPVTRISWNDAVAYCEWLSKQEKATYRLPTEAEWEYACRAGTTTSYSFGNEAKGILQYGWFKDNTTPNGSLGTVGKKPPNPFGLYDMHGNVLEWCSDFYDEKWYEKSPLNDPTGPDSGQQHVCRSGYFGYLGHSWRSASRYSKTITWSGFRIVRELTTTSTSASVTPQPTVPAAAPAKPITDFNSSEFQAWIKEVQAMPAEEQVKAVSKKLMELNPGFDGTVTGVNGQRQPTPTIANGVVTSIGFVSDNVQDISPVRALAGLKSLSCKGSGSPKNKMSDLSPLNGMPLTLLDCIGSNVSDLSPLQGMPLTQLNLSYTAVFDLTPLEGMKLTSMDCIGTKVSDLLPLRGMPLKSLNVVSTSVTPASVTVLQKALPNCKIEWDDPAKATTPQPGSSRTTAPARPPTSSGTREPTRPPTSPGTREPTRPPTSPGTTAPARPPASGTK